MASFKNGTTSPAELDKLFPATDDSAEIKAAKKAKREARKAKAIKRILIADLLYNQVQVVVNESPVFTMQVENAEAVKAFIWMQLEGVSGDAVVRIIK